jgi:hypothetical protein
MSGKTLDESHYQLLPPQWCRKGLLPEPDDRRFANIGLVEAAGVELFNPLILCKLLVLLEATSAKNASLPGRRYKNGTKF